MSGFSVDGGDSALGRGWTGGDESLPTWDKVWDVGRERVRSGPNPYPGRPDGWAPELEHNPWATPIGTVGEAKAAETRVRHLRLNKLHWPLHWSWKLRKVVLLCGELASGTRKMLWARDGCFYGLNFRTMWMWRGVTNCGRCLLSVRLIREGKVEEARQLRSEWSLGRTLPASAAHVLRAPSPAEAFEAAEREGSEARVADLFGVWGAVSAETGPRAGVRAQVPAFESPPRGGRKDP